MNSSEMADSGMFSGGRSKFSRTCSLLSQYLKEKGSFGDLTLGLTHNSEIKGATTESVDLLPTIAKSDFCDAKSEAETAQMTIFYAGQVMVFDGFPTDKAKEIVMLANKAIQQNQQSPAESTTAIVVPTFAKEDLFPDLPIARKNSLARFLEKRKDRIKANAPYQATKSMESTPQLPLQMQRQY